MLMFSIGNELLQVKCMMVKFKTTHNTYAQLLNQRHDHSLALFGYLCNLEIPGREKSYIFSKIKLFNEKFLECNFK